MRVSNRFYLGILNAVIPGILFWLLLYMIVRSF